MRLFTFSLAIALCVLVGLGLTRRLQRPRRAVAAVAVSTVAPGGRETVVPAAAPLPPRPDSVVAFALRQLGAAYRYGGTTPATGFDCSGFVQYVYRRFGVAVPHSTALLITAGQPVPRHLARPGDLVVFVGTAAGATTPGHAGVVVSAGPGGLRFVHSSSARRESGVKISRVEGTDYERRFMQVRRVL